MAQPSCRVAGRGGPALSEQPFAAAAPASAPAALPDAATEAGGPELSHLQRTLPAEKLLWTALRRWGGARDNDDGIGSVMTKALQDAFKEAEKLPEAEQDQLAAAIRAEIAAERAWDTRLTTSGDALAGLADEALTEHRSGRTLPLDSDKQ